MKEELLQKKNTAVERETTLKDKHREAWMGWSSVSIIQSLITGNLLVVLSYKFETSFSLIFYFHSAYCFRSVVFFSCQSYVSSFILVTIFSLVQISILCSSANLLYDNMIFRRLAISAEKKKDKANKMFKEIDSNDDGK